MNYLDPWLIILLLEFLASCWLGYQGAKRVGGPKTPGCLKIPLRIVVFMLIGSVTMLVVLVINVLVGAPIQAYFQLT